jgi:hypothetical protein
MLTKHQLKECVSFPVTTHLNDQVIRWKECLETASSSSNFLITAVRKVRHVRAWGIPTVCQIYKTMQLSRCSLVLYRDPE